MQNQTQQQGMAGLAYRNRHVILIISVIGVLMAMLDGVMVNQALPAMTMQFQVSLAHSQWVITAYLLVMTSLLIVFGKLSEYFGKVKIYMAGWLIFTLGSLACGLSGSIDQLIAFRVLQAFGAAMVSGVGGAILYLAFPPQERGKAMGAFGGTVALAALIGPGLGGFIVDSLGWESIFFVNVPIGVFLLALALKYLRLPEVTTKRLEMDWIGAATLVVSAAALILFCTELANGLKITVPLAIYGVAFVLAAAVFGLQESRSAKPLLDLSIFRSRLFALPLVAAMLGSVAIAFINTLGPFYCQIALGLTSSQTGTLFMVTPLLMLITAPVSGVLYDKHHWKYASAAGMVIAGVGFILLGFALWWMSLPLIIAAFAIRGAGTGFFTSPNSTETMNALPKEKVAIASSSSTMVQFLASTLGVSLSVVIFTQGLKLAGFDGLVMLAPPSAVASTMAALTMIAGALCFVAAAVSALRNV